MSSSNSVPTVRRLSGGYNRLALFVEGRRRGRGGQAVSLLHPFFSVDRYAPYREIDGAVGVGRPFGSLGPFAEHPGPGYRPIMS